MLRRRCRTSEAAREGMHDPPEGGVQLQLKRWSGKRDSNPRQPAWKAGALPLSYSRQCNGGQGGIRTPVGIANRFTVCRH